MQLAVVKIKIHHKEHTYKEYDAMIPVDLDQIKSSSDTEKRQENASRYFVQQAVLYLRDIKKDLPKAADPQDYEHVSWQWKSFNSIDDLITEYKEINGIKEDDKPEDIDVRVYDNVFDNIILPKGFKEKIIEAVSQLKDANTIFKDWGFEDKFKNRGTGINILFSGDSGTGKTYCAEIIAEYLGVKTNLVSVSRIESKWIGESEQNVAGLFTGLKMNSPLLILDEVDALLSTRSNGDNNPYHGKLVNEFLINLERHSGICIMTTNRPVILDKALARRIDLVLNFPAPNKEARKRIWKYMVPKKLPQTTLDFDKLAEIEMNGGIIKNAVLAAARYMVTNKTLFNKFSKCTTELLLEKAKEELLEVTNLHEGEDFSK